MLSLREVWCVHVSCMLSLACTCCCTRRQRAAMVPPPPCIDSLTGSIIYSAPCTLGENRALTTDNMHNIQHWRCRNAHGSCSSYTHNYPVKGGKVLCQRREILDSSITSTPNPLRLPTWVVDCGLWVVVGVTQDSISIYNDYSPTNP